LFNRIKKYRNGLNGASLGCVCAVVIHLSLIILLSGHFSFSYGEIGQRMSGYPLIVSKDIETVEKYSSNSEKLASLNAVPASQKCPHFSVEGAGRIIPTAPSGSPNSGKLAKIPPAQSIPKQRNFSSLDSEESVFLAVYLNKRMLTEVLEAKEKNGSLYIRLDKIARLFDAVPPKDANAIATSEALEEIFPVKFEYSKKHQALIIEGEGKLPIEQKWAREYQHKMLGNNVIKEDTPVVNFDYGLLGQPSLDVSASYLKNGRKYFNYSFKGGMEALYGTASIFGRGGTNGDTLEDLRISWERLHSDWYVQLGDVFAPPIELVAQANAGRGINLTNIPIENATQFGTDTISGDLLDGWEVELYRGNTLLDVRQSDGSGRFVFRDVALLFGKNDITLKFYGPQGQFRQESRSVNIGRGMVPEGKVWTRFSFTEQGENIFLGRNSRTRAHIEGFRTHGQVFYGLSKNLTLTGSATSFKSDTLERRTLGKVGFQISYFGSSLKMDFIADDNDGYGIQSSFFSRLMGWGLQYDNVEFFDLETDLEPNLKRSRKLRLYRGIGDAFVDLSAEQRVQTFGVTRYEYDAKISGNVEPVFLTSDWNANFGGGTDFVRADFLASGRINQNLLLRANLNYDVHPEVEFRSVQSTLDYRPKKDVTLRLNVVKNLIDQKDFVISQSVLWEGKKVGLGLTGSYSTEQDFLVTASVTFSLSPNLSGGYQVNRNSSTNVGTVNVRVFLDHDQDGKYSSESDELLENIRLKNRSDESDRNGMIAFKGPAYHLAKIMIDEKTLPDPFMVTVPPMAVRPRPTHINTLNIPVWETGEIEGQVEPGELVELIEDGKVIATTHAEFDGFFLFEKLRFKKYRVRSGHRIQIVEINRAHPIARVKWKREYQLAKS